MTATCLLIVGVLPPHIHNLLDISKAAKPSTVPAIDLICTPDKLIGVSASCELYPIPPAVLSPQAYTLLEKSIAANVLSPAITSFIGTFKKGCNAPKNIYPFIPVPPFVGEPVIYKLLD